MVRQILRESREVMLWPGLALAGALVQAYLSLGQASGMQEAMRSTFLPLEEIPERGKEVGGGSVSQMLVSVCLPRPHTVGTAL